MLVEIEYCSQCASYKMRWKDMDEEYPDGSSLIEAYCRKNNKLIGEIKKRNEDYIEIPNWCPMAKKEEE